MFTFTFLTHDLSLGHLLATSVCSVLSLGQRGDILVEYVNESGVIKVGKFSEVWATLCEINKTRVIISR